MTAPDSDSPTEVRERLEQQADAVRERLFSDIGELTHRAQSAEALFETVTDYAKRYKTPLIAAGVGITVLSAIAFFQHRATVARRERQRALSTFALRLVGTALSSMR